MSKLWPSVVGYITLTRIIRQSPCRCEIRPIRPDATALPAPGTTCPKLALYFGGRRADDSPKLALSAKRHWWTGRGGKGAGQAAADASPALLAPAPAPGRGARDPGAGRALPTLPQRRRHRQGRHAVQYDIYLADRRPHSG